MNKAQISYFCNALKIAVRRAKEDLRARYPVIQGYSREEKLGFISRGEARFKEELYQGDDCPFVSGNNALAVLFEYPGETEVKGQNALQKRILQAVDKRIDTKAQRLEEDFVMKEVDDPRVALRNFTAEQHETDGERSQLKAIQAAVSARKTEAVAAA